MKHLSPDAIAAAEAVSLHHLIAADDALRSALHGSGIPRPNTDAVEALRSSADFLYQAAFALIASAALDDGGVLNLYRFALAKLIEFAALLPSEAQTVPVRYFGTLAHPVEPTPILPASSYGSGCCNGGEV
ncbi:hypothetical protein ASD83_15585 [Devosia sp. Root685]|nr:hypothetical protein ASD83_15585 [Devosia sp. Root685]